MGRITGLLKKMKKSIPLDNGFKEISDPRRTCFLPIDAILWLIVVMFAFRRAYSLLKMDEYLRGLNLKKTRTLFELLAPGQLNSKGMRKLRDKQEANEPLISDCQLAKILRAVDPMQLEPLLFQTAMKLRRNKTWQGMEQIAAIDGSREGGSCEARCPYCKRASDNSYYHFGVHLTQITQKPFVSLGYQPVRAKQGELTVAKILCRRAIERCRGRRYADVIVADFLYSDHEFINMHRAVGMGVVLRGQEKDGTPPKDLNVFEDARLLFEQQGAPNDTFTDAKRNRTVRIWDAEDFEGWAGLSGTLRVLRFEFVDLKSGKTQAHWAITTIPKADATPRRIYRLTVARWRIENNVFRQEKTFEGFEHRQIHDAEGRGSWAIQILYLLAMTIVQWIAFRRYPSTRRRLTATRYSFDQFREDLFEAWVIWLHEKASAIDLRILPPP